MRSYTRSGNKIDLPVKQFFQFLSQINKLNADRLTEIDDNIYVTFWSEISSHNRTKQADRVYMILFK